MFFLVAGPWNQISFEFDMKQDLIWIDKKEAYSDSESVLTTKTSAFLGIVHKAAKQLSLNYTHIFKTDDDSYVDLRKLYHLLLSESSLTKTPDYLGQCGTKRLAPIRDLKRKWSVSADLYPEPLYPTYCQGAGFALSRRFVECAAEENLANIRYLPFEDVFVGLLSQRCNISPTHDHLRRFRMWRSSASGTKEERNVIRHGLAKREDGDWIVE